MDKINISVKKHTIVIKFLETKGLKLFRTFIFVHASKNIYPYLQGKHTQLCFGGNIRWYR